MSEAAGRGGKARYGSVGSLASNQGPDTKYAIHPSRALGQDEGGTRCLYVDVSIIITVQFSYHDETTKESSKRVEKVLFL